MTTKFDHIIAIDGWNRHPYAGFEGRELWRNESNTGWNWKKWDDNPKKWTPPTEGIKISSQCNPYDPEGERRMYALTCKQSEEMTIKDIEQAEANLKRLKKIGKKYDELCQKYGYPATFARYAAYIAEATGAKLAMYNTFAADYTEVTVSEIEAKEQRMLYPEKA